MAFTVKISGLNEVQAKVKNIVARLEPKIDQAVARNVDEMVQRGKRDAPKNYGRLSGSIQRSKIASMRHSMVAQAFHAAFLEFGTKGNYRPIPGTEEIAAQFKGQKGEGQLKMFDAILAWVKAKGIAGTYSVKTRRRTGSKAKQQLENERVAFLIMMSILKHGIKPQPYFFKQGPIQEPRLNQDIQQIVKAIQL
jgi:hypothetical protein